MSQILPDPTSPLSPADAAAAFAAMLDGEAEPDEIARFLTLMSARDETAVEIAACANAMRARMVTVAAPANAIDVCGTGADGQHSLNISTAVAIVVAACGVPVAKHGNRAASSKAGAADTLEALGLDLDIASDTAERSLSDLGIAFLFAQKHHPALKPLAPIRRAIGRRTVFNLVGPLCNPGQVRRQLIGIARPDFMPVYADALRLLALDAAWLVAGDEPLDELSIAGPSTVFEVTPAGVVSRRVAPGNAGLRAHGLDAIRGDDAAYNAAALRRLLMGEGSAYRDAVLLNAAAALVVAGVASDLPDGAATAAQAIDDQTALHLLERWVAYR